MAEVLWTNSRLRAYQACPMKEKLRYRDCLAPLGRKEALGIGSAVHKGIELWSAEAAVAEMEATFSFPGSTEEADAQEIQKGTVAAMLGGYFERFEPFEKHEPELEFKIGARYPTKRGMRRSNRVHLAGKIDDIVELDGECWLVEYKTAGQIDKSYFDRLYVDSQITFYMMAARRLGYAPVGVIYRVLRKPQIRRRQGETVEAFIERMAQDCKARPEFYYYETRLYRSQDDLEAFERDLWGEITQAEKNASQGRFWRHSHACSNYGSCAYLPLCMGEAGAEAMFEHRAPNEELAICGENEKGGYNTHSGRSLRPAQCNHRRRAHHLRPPTSCHRGGDIRRSSRILRRGHPDSPRRRSRLRFRRRCSSCGSAARRTLRRQAKAHLRSPDKKSDPRVRRPLLSFVLRMPHRNGGACGG